MIQKNSIKIIGARHHNLKNISIEIPKNKLVVITGPSGSGKSTLAIDIIYAEGQRRYIESLPSYVRQFLGQLEKADVEEIQGICPSICIDQKTVSGNLRSTVGTTTEIYEYIRVMFAHLGIIHCVKCKKPVEPIDSEELTKKIIEKYKEKNIYIVAPLIKEEKGSFDTIFDQFFRKGYRKFLINQEIVTINQLEDIVNLKLRKNIFYTIDLFLGSFLGSDLSQDFSDIKQAIEKSFEYAKDIVKIIETDHYDYEFFTKNISCLTCKISYNLLDARQFSFNSPIGACERCKGTGISENIFRQSESEMDILEKEGIDLFKCNLCRGERLNTVSRHVKMFGLVIHQVSNLDLKELKDFLSNLEQQLNNHQKLLTLKLFQEAFRRIIFLIEVGLPYLTLSRSSRTLSGGEAQRIRLATQIGSGLSGIIYVLDEPSIGLHQSDNDKLIKTLKALKDLNNTLIIVEHDRDTMKHADYIIDIGPEAGINGGAIVFEGSYADILKSKTSTTGMYLSNRLNLKRNKKPRNFAESITIKNCTKNNLKNIDVLIPLNVFCCISGISGSGKSSLVFEELIPALKFKKMGSIINVFDGKKTIKAPETNINKFNEKIEGGQSIRHMVVIDQKSIGKTPRSNIATYLGLFDDIRILYSKIPESMARGYTAGTFSFNVGKGRCQKCSGQGKIIYSMYMLPDVQLACKDCRATGYSQSVLDIVYNGKNIYEILQMPVSQALEFFKNHSKLFKKLDILNRIGLDYITLGQSSLTFSGGESQRIKLADELSKRTNDTIYILDEPTTGLHFQDIKKLLSIFDELVNKGNTVLVIEHNIEVLAYSDYVIDMGPEGGKNGGYVLAVGTPEEVSKNDNSKTGKYIKEYLKELEI